MRAETGSSSHAPSPADRRLYLVTPVRVDLEDFLEAAIRGGVDIVQVRERDLTDGELLRALEGVRAVTHRLGVPLVVNDRPDLAVLCGADFVHVGQDDLPARDVRALMGPRALIGVSAATVEEGVAAEREGADYLGVGAIYATGTKPDAGAPVGLDRLREIGRAVRLPLVGIGGITADNAAAVIRAGASGVAVITAVTLAEDMTAAARRLREEVDAAISR